MENKFYIDCPKFTGRNVPITEIAKACEEIFKVKVAKVNTINVRGQARRMGRYSGYTSSWKKAIVTLKADSKPIEFFDGLM